MSEQDKCKHQGQLIPQENFGFEYDQETGNYYQVTDEDIPARCHIDAWCTVCYEVVKIKITATIVHRKEVS